MQNRKNAPVLLGLGLMIALAGLATPVAGQQARQVLNTALEKYEARMRNVENYTLVMEVMGSTFESRYEKQMVDGRAVFLPTDQRGAATDETTRYLRAFAEHAQYVGREEVDGFDTHVLRVDDASGIDWKATFGQASIESFTPQVLTLYIDTRDHVLRRMNLKGTATIQGGTKPIDAWFDYQDYREVSGMLHPFQSRFRMDGLMQASNVSESERARAAASLAQLERQMASVPEAQRAMMERMIGGQLATLRRMVETNSLDMSVVARELRVNEPARR